MTYKFAQPKSKKYAPHYNAKCKAEALRRVEHRENKNFRPE